MMNWEMRATQKNRSTRFLSTLLLLVIFSLAQDAFAQSQNSVHTLKLDHPENMPAATVNDVAWIAGHFQGEVFGGICEEVWMPPFGGTMMGMFKVVRGDTIVFYEFLTITEESNSLNFKLKHFHPDLTGWEEKGEFISFPLVKLTRDTAFFDGLTFQKLDQNTIQVYLALRRNGEIRETEFKYHRVKSKGVSADN